ncbi:AAA family ATPase, partial [Streptococcus porcinus]
MKITKATDLQRTNNWRILIYGKAGLGKTSLIKQLIGNTLVLS